MSGLPTMDTLQREMRGDLLVLRFAKPRANAIDEALVMDLLTALSEAREDPAVRGVLLASAHPRVFCPGLDLRFILGLDRSQMNNFMARFIELIRRLYAFEKPMTAAVAGYAVAGGCILALTADLRIIAGSDVTMGLNEGRAGLPLPWTVTVLLRNVLGSRRLEEVALRGRNFDGAGAVDAGLAHELHEGSGGFEEHCLEKLAALASQEPVTYAVTKRHFRTPAVDQMRLDEPRHLETFIDAAMHPAVRARIESTVEGLASSK